MKLHLFNYLFWTVAIAMAAAGCSNSSSSDVAGSEPSNTGSSFNATDAVGASAGDLLREGNFTRLVVEVDWIGDFRPSGAGMDSLKVFLEQRLHKPGGVEILFDESIPSPGLENYTTDDVRNLEADHRSRHTDGGTLVVYLLALDAKFETENVLGIAYFNTSMAIFQEEIERQTGGTFQPGQVIVEGAVLRHEMGHLMGLVNNGTPMLGQQGGEDDHHDEENGAHCTVEGSLMHFQIRTSNFSNIMMESYIPRLEPLDIADLQANGGK